MRRIGLIKVLAVALAVGVCLLIAPASDHDLASVELRHPTTLVSLVATRLRAIPPYVGQLIDDGTAGFRKIVQKHEGPKESLER